MSGASSSVWQNPSAVIHPKRQPPEYVFLIDHLRCYGEDDDEDGTPDVAKAVCECDWRLIQSLRGQTPDERYKISDYTTNSQTPDERYKISDYT